MQGINTGDACHPECPPAYPLFLQFPLIIVGDDKPAQNKKETDPDKSLLKEMSVEKAVYNITMRPKTIRAKIKRREVRGVII